MNSLKAQFSTRFALIVMVIMVVLAGCDSTGIPSGGTPIAVATSTPKTVASAPSETPKSAEPTPTLVEFFPIETPTKVVGGSGLLNTPTPRPQATATTIPQVEATATSAEPTEEAIAKPTEEATAVVGGEPTPTLMPQTVRLDLFEQVWDTVDTHYLYRDFRGLDWQAQHDKYQALVKSAKTSTEYYDEISTMVSDLKDDHSRYLSPAAAREEDDLQSGNANYVGVGIISSPLDKSVLVIFVFKNSPAEKAGLKRRDQIVAIDGKPLEDPTNISNVIRGPAGTTVTLTVVSPGQAERDIPIVRGKITGAIVPTASRLEKEPGIGYLIIPDLFTNNMGDLVEKELNSLLVGKPKLTGLVIDLRGNGGGFRTVLEQILGFFIEGDVGTFFDANNSYPLTITASAIQSKLKDIPVVILTDGGAESYAEVLAASIQEKGRAKVVGVHSAGNTETIYQYNFDDGSRLWCAQEGFKRLDGSNLEGTGVIPDYVIDVEWTSYPESEDPHILKAIELIKQQ
ncbi:MAG: S41 family peptidase [Chloroflexia bacterium]